MFNSTITPLGSALPDGWKLRPLGELCSKIGSGSTPRGGSAVYVSEGTSFVRSQNVLDHKFSVDGLARISAADAGRMTGVVVEVDDVLLNITGDGETIARCCVAPREILPARVNQHVMIIRPRKELIEPHYLQKYVSHPRFRQYMLSHNSGGSRRALTKGQIEKFLIAVPPLYLQSGIAEVLVALDDKIAVNDRIAATSRKILETLFRSITATKSRRVELREIVELHYGKALKTSDRTPGKVPIFGGNGVSGSHNRPLVSGPGIIIGRKGANAGSVSWSNCDFWPIDTAFYATPRNSILPMEFLFLLLRGAPLRDEVGDSAIPGLNRDIALSIKVWIPEVEAAMKFAQQARPHFKLQGQMEEENRTLAGLRDTLLPRLMSGQVRIRDAEKVVEDAV